jgi:hypothetical protein
MHKLCIALLAALMALATWAKDAPCSPKTRRSKHG